MKFGQANISALRSGEFVDPTWQSDWSDDDEEPEPRTVTTDFSFQEDMLFRLKDSKAAVGIFHGLSLFRHDCPTG
jgi:hypothetical protein